MAFSGEQLAIESDAHICPDYGTSLSSLSSAIATLRGLDTNGNKPKIIVHDKYAYKQAHLSPNPTTDAYFDPSRSKPLIGFELTADPRIGDGDYDENRLFRYLKLIAHEPKLGDAREIFDRLTKQAERLGKTPAELLEVFAIDFYTSNLRSLRENNHWGEGTKLHLAITVPAGWSKEEHALMLSGFLKYALTHGVDPDCIILVTEPQAQLLWRAHEKEDRGEPYKSGDLIEIADLGGGTTCICIFEITRSDGSELIPVGESISISNGMQLLSHQFGEIVKERLQNVLFSPQIDIEHAAEKAIKQFEVKKLTFGPLHTDPVEIYIKGLRENVTRRFRKDTMIFSYEEIKALFDHFFKDTIREMRRIIPQGRFLDEIYFTGGGAQNEFLWSQLWNEFANERENHGLALVRQATYDKSAVSNGGVLASLHASMGHDIVKKLIVAKTQSILIHVEYAGDLRDHFRGQNVAPVRSAEGNREFIFMLEHFIQKDEPVPDDRNTLVRGFQDTKLGQFGYKLFGWEELYIGEGGAEVEDLLIVMDQLPDTLDDDFRGKSAVTAEFGDAEIGITGFRDLRGNLIITGTEISRELKWTLDLPRRVYEQIKKNTAQQGRVRIDYRYILQVNELGETQYLAEVHWYSQPSWRNKRLSKPRLKLCKKRFPATANPVKGGTFNIVRMTRTCAATYALPHHDKDAGKMPRDSPHFSQSRASPLTSSSTATNRQRRRKQVEKQIPSGSSRRVIPRSSSPSQYNQSSSSLQRRLPGTSPLSNTVHEGSVYSGADDEDEQEESWRDRREKRSTKRRRAPSAYTSTQDDDSIPARPPASQASNRRPRDKDDPGLRAPVTQKGKGKGNGKGKGKKHS